MASPSNANSNTNSNSNANNSAFPHPNAHPNSVMPLTFPAGGVVLMEYKDPQSQQQQQQQLRNLAIPNAAPLGAAPSQQSPVVPFNLVDPSWPHLQWQIPPFAMWPSPQTSSAAVSGLLNPNSVPMAAMAQVPSMAASMLPSIPPPMLPANALASLPPQENKLFWPFFPGTIPMTAPAAPTSGPILPPASASNSSASASASAPAPAPTPQQTQPLQGFIPPLGHVNNNFGIQFPTIVSMPTVFMPSNNLPQQMMAAAPPTVTAVNLATMPPLPETVAQRVASSSSPASSPPSSPSPLVVPSRRGPLALSERRQQQLSVSLPFQPNRMEFHRSPSSSPSSSSSSSPSLALSLMSTGPSSSSSTPLPPPPTSTPPLSQSTILPSSAPNFMSSNGSISSNGSGSGSRNSSSSSSFAPNRRQVCPICNKVLKGHRAALNRHMLLHTGEMPYSCPVCHKRFRQQINMTVHMTVHESGSSFECAECGVMYRFYSSLKRHEQKFHPQLHRHS